MSLEALRKQVSAAQAAAIKEDVKGHVGDAQTDAIKQRPEILAVAERIKKQLPESSKEWFGKDLDRLLEVIGYIHVNNLFGEDMYGKPFNLEMVITGLKDRRVIEMHLYFCESIIKLYDKLLKAIDEHRDDHRKVFEDNFEPIFRTFIGYTKRFHKIVF